MRVVESTVGEIRRKVFTEVARLAYEGGDLMRIEQLPYQIIPGEVATYRESIFLERAIVGERLRLAIGLPLRPLDAHAPISLGIEESAISAKYYDPPLVNIIKFACNACPDMYQVSDCCQGCLAHPCTAVCPVGAVTIPGRRAVIDHEKCIMCGRCKEVCPYTAIIHLERPCSAVCGVDAIRRDAHDLADIDYDKCVSCGMCIANCPFGAITDKGQMFQLIHALKSEACVVAILAPAFIGQFGKGVTLDILAAAIRELGFSHVAEVAVGADLCAVEEAKDFLRTVPDERPYMATSCCPSCIMLTENEFPELLPNVSMALTPMVLSGRLQKQRFPNCKVAFIGPCAAKKLEASRSTIRSDVDFVITFEELMGMFDAKGIRLPEVPPGEPLTEATADGRGFPAPGGVAKAVVDVIGQLQPGVEVKVAAADGLRDCRKTLRLAKAGKYDGYLLEGMACPGGCMAGTGTLVSASKTIPLVEPFAKSSERQNALETPHEITPELLKRM